MKHEIVCFDGTSVAIIRHHSFQGIMDGEFTIIPRRISHATLNKKFNFSISRHFCGLLSVRKVVVYRIHVRLVE